MSKQWMLPRNAMKKTAVYRSALYTLHKIAYCKHEKIISIYLFANMRKSSLMTP